MLKAKRKLSLVIVFVLFALCLVGVAFLAASFVKGKVLQKQFIIQLAQYSVLIVGIFLPLSLEKLHLNVGIILWINFYTFIFLSIFIGSILNVYDGFEYYDVIVHTYGGIFSALLAFSLSKNEKNNLIKFIFCISFATLVGVLWEFYEFSFDRMFNLNMQRTVNIATGKSYQGWLAIFDTMLDLFCDVIGATIISLLCFFKISKSKQILISKK